MLRSVDFDAAGDYSCEVSTDTPIYTKESNVDYIHVIRKYRRNSEVVEWRFLILNLGFPESSNISEPQTGPPKIAFSKRQFYIGENLEANCTTSRARPQPHITWLINGKKVNIRRLRSIIIGTRCCEFQIIHLWLFLYIVFPLSSLRR